MSCLAIITARGGSKRIPRKNIKLFMGQPVMKYSVDAALNAGCFDEIMVSTDDQEISELAIKLGASVPFMRSENNSDDHAGTADVIEEVLIDYSKKGIEFEYACCMYPTAPFVTADKILVAFRKLIDKNGDALVPVCRFSYPIQRAYKIENDSLVYINPEYVVARSQDLAPAYHDVGQFYWYKVGSFLNRRIKPDYKVIPMIIPEMEMQDLDTADDWEVAEFKYRWLHSKQV